LARRSAATLTCTVVVTKDFKRRFLYFFARLKSRNSDFRNFGENPPRHWVKVPKTGQSQASEAEAALVNALAKYLLEENKYRYKEYKN
jgi:hypothetical protein